MTIAKADIQSTANIDNFEMNKDNMINDIERFFDLLNKKFNQNISSTIYAEYNKEI